MKGDTGSKGDTGDAGPQGVAGPTSLVKATPEPAGLNCATGGQRIDIGVDTNSNGSLDTGEIQETVYVCNGSALDGGSANGGNAGVAGAAGAIGGTGAGGASGSGSGIESTTASIVVEPSDSGQAFKAGLQNATTSIDLGAHVLTDSAIISLLVEKCASGVDVRVLLDGSSIDKEENTPAVTTLSAAGAKVQFPPNGLDVYQQDTAIIDSTSAWILTGDLSVAAWGNRQYVALDSEVDTVGELEQLFLADWFGQPVGAVSNIVVAPQNARARLLQLIASAVQEIDIEGQIIGESEVVSAIATASARGVLVKIVLDNAETGNSAESNAIAALKAAGAMIATPGKLTVQANALVVDNNLAYVGSVDFSSAMLDLRAVGIVVSNVPAVSIIASSIAADFGQGTAL